VPTTISDSFKADFSLDEGRERKTEDGLRHSDHRMLRSYRCSVSNAVVYQLLKVFEARS
jgi:hypothetical protein